MFTANDIERAGRIVKTATAGTVGPLKVDPYQANQWDLWQPSVKQMGWSQPDRPGFFKSLGKSIAGTAMRPFDFARSAIGAAPGQSMLRNYMHGYGPWMEANVVGPVMGWTQSQKDEAMNEFHQNMRSQGPGNAYWEKPLLRASEQSARYQHAFPEYMSRHPFGRFLLHPSEESYKFMRKAFPSWQPPG